MLVTNMFLHLYNSEHILLVTYPESLQGYNLKTATEPENCF